MEDNQVDHWLSVVRSSYDAIRRNTVHATDDSVAGIGLEIMSDHTVTSDNTVDGGQQVGLQQSPGPGYQYWGYNTVRNMIMWGMQLQGDGASETEQFQYSIRTASRIRRRTTTARLIRMLANLLWHDRQPDAVAVEFSHGDEIGAWAADAVAKAVQAGVVAGYADGSFRPDQPITRAEMAVMLAKATKAAGSSGEGAAFSDDAAIPAWARKSVAAIARAGLAEGRADGSFDPGAALNRAEAGVILSRLLHAQP